MCFDCRYWDFSVDDIYYLAMSSRPAVGEEHCKKTPPRSTPGESPWPKTGPSGWCGEFVLDESRRAILKLAIRVEDAITEMNNSQTMEDGLRDRLISLLRGGRGYTGELPARWSAGDFCASRDRSRNK